MRDFPYWLAMSRISVLGARRIRRLVEAFGSAEKAFTADFDALVAAGLPGKVVNTMIAERTAVNPGREVEKLHALGYKALTLHDSTYPKLLKEIFDPPAVLYYKGDINVLEFPSVAVVGSRKATEYGRVTAAKLSGDLAALGVTVVSGMARGIDTAAHQGVLRSAGRTAAVLGCGLDVCYPPENRKLRDEILHEGVLLSEFPPGTQPKPPHFPMRNRVISGLSLAVVVVEAAERSGALITADCALEQGREVFAVPGSIHSPTSRGCHRMLKEGAAVAENVGDISSVLGLFSLESGKNEQQRKLSPVQKNVLTVMEYEPIHFDQVMDKCGLSAGELAGILLELELSGAVKKITGNFYLRV